MSAYEIVQLVLRERQSRDRGWYDQMADCFAEDSVVEMSWFQGSGADFVRATAHHLGDDQPEAVEPQYQAGMTWLHQSRTPAATAGN